MSRINRKKKYKLIYTLIIILIVSLSYILNPINSDSLVEPFVSEINDVMFISCVDGDTAKFSINGDKKTVRFLAIDTPETVHPYKNTEEYGKSASDYTCNKLKNANSIKLEVEETSAKLDKYNRLLAWVFIDGNLLQKQLIDIGYAKVKYIYAKYKYTSLLLESEKLAKKEKLGIWNNYIDKKYNIKNKYTVTFKYNNTKQIIFVNEGDKIDILNNPKNGTKEFEGWKNNGNLFDAINPITKNITLVASFK